MSTPMQRPASTAVPLAAAAPLPRCLCTHPADAPPAAATPRCPQVILSVLFIAVQFSAFVWYCASYIPYGQAMIKRVLGFGSADAAEG